MSGGSGQREHDAKDEFRAARLEVAAARATARRPLRGRPGQIAWLTDEDERTARERWPGWTASLRVDEPFTERAARMERTLRAHHADGDGPLWIVTMDLARYAAWCEAEGHDPADRRSRGSFVALERDAGNGRRWPPSRNEPCWCESERKYKRCCGALATKATDASAGG